jgi:hypothetical protein
VSGMPQCGGAPASSARFRLRRFGRHDRADEVSVLRL